MTITSEPSQTSENSNATFLEDKAALDKMKEWSTFVQEEYTKCKSSRMPVERQWYLNMAMFYGQQYVTFIGQNNPGLAAAGAKLYTPKAPPWRTRLVVNRTRAAVRAELAKITSQKPSASVVPASGDDEDLLAAQAAEQVWESQYASIGIAKTFRRQAFWEVITGNGFTKDWWDEDAIDKATGVKGAICVEEITPFHLFVPDLREVELEKQRYVLNVFTMELKAAQAKYADKLEGRSISANIVSQNEIIEDARLNLTSSTKEDSVLIYEMWMKPGTHVDFPDGGFIQMVGQEIITVRTDLIYSHGEYPFTHFPHIPSGKFYATSVVEDIIPLQKEYNRTRSQLIEAQNRMSKPQLMAPQGSVDASKITSEPGIVIFYRPGLAPPQPLPLQGIPSYVSEGLDRTLMDIEDITSQHQVSKGNTPAGVTAATAISYLQERDDSVLSPTFTAVEEGMEKIARHVLTMVVQFWDVNRTVRVTGDNESFDTLVLKGADIANALDIRMEGGSSLPVSKAARQAFIMDMMKMGFIDPNKGLRLMEIGGVQKLYEELQIDERQAQRENLRMKLLQTTVLASWEEQQAQASAFAQQVQQMSNMDPTTHGLPQDFPVLPPDFPGNSPAPQTGMPPSDPSQMGMPPEMGGMPPEQMAPYARDDGTLQSSENLDPTTGLPLDLPLLVPTNSWDNHAVHIEMHNRYRKSQEFEKMDKEHKRLFEAHVQEHAAALASSANMAMMGGAPPDAIGGGPMPPQDESGGSNQFNTLGGEQNG